MALSDTKKWSELEEKVRSINKAVQEAKQFAEENELLLTVDEGHFTPFGRGLLCGYDFSKGEPLPAIEVWQSSTGCSDQGITSVKDIRRWGYTILTPIPKD